MGSIESGRATHHEGFPRTFPIISIPAPGQHGVADALINIAPENSQKTNQHIVPKQTARDAIKFRDTLIMRIGFGIPSQALTTSRNLSCGSASSLLSFTMCLMNGPYVPVRGSFQ